MTMNELSSLVFMALRLLAISLLFLVVVQILQGAVLARGLNAALYENFTDVDVIFSANPHIIDQPKPIKKMTYI